MIGYGKADRSNPCQDQNPLANVGSSPNSILLWTNFSHTRKKKFSLTRARATAVRREGGIERESKSPAPMEPKRRGVGVGRGASFFLPAAVEVASIGATSPRTLLAPRANHRQILPIRWISGANIEKRHCIAWFSRGCAKTPLISISVLPSELQIRPILDMCKFLSYCSISLFHLRPASDNSNSQTL